MPNRRRDRQRKPARPDAFRDPRPVVLVVCEGIITEPQYISGFGRAHRNGRVRVEVAPEHGVPRTVVEAARNRKRAAEVTAEKHEDDNLAYDSVWCVFDIDQHPNVSDAKQMALANGIKLAISNPCFELWLLLHFRDPPGSEDRHTIQARLSEYITDYNKHVDVEVFLPYYPEAAKRAASLDRLARQVNLPDRNPTTGVYKLLEEIAAQLQ